MKTREFLNRITDSGLTVELDGTQVMTISDSDNTRYIADVHMGKVNKISTSFGEDTPKWLFDLLVEYACTPLDEREDPKIYRVRIPSVHSRNGDQILMYDMATCCYFVGAKVTKSCVMTTFTKEQLNDAPKWIKPEWLEEVK